MSVAEFNVWQRYAAQQRLPMRRLELYEAQTAFLIAKTMGGSKASSARDFLFQFVPPVDVEIATAAEHAEMLSGITGKGVIVLGQKRRKREGKA